MANCRPDLHLWKEREEGSLCLCGKAHWHIKECGEIAKVHVWNMGQIYCRCEMKVVAPWAIAREPKLIMVDKPSWFRSLLNYIAPGFFPLKGKR